MEDQTNMRRPPPRKTMIALLRGGMDRIADFVEDRMERIFESTRKLDFGGRINRHALIVDDEATRASANPYEGTSARALRLLITEARRYMPPFDNFIDVGSGKGKASIIAARDGGFLHVSGVELSPPLVTIASENARRAGVPDVEFICCDASLHVLRPGSTFVYINNPFDAPLLAKFMEVNAAHFTTYQSVIAYCHDWHRDVILDAGFETIQRDQQIKASILRLRPEVRVVPIYC